MSKTPDYDYARALLPPFDAGEPKTQVRDDPPPIHLTINGQEVVYLQASLSTWDGPLAYPSHVDENGNMKFEAVFLDSFAHVFDDGTIKRYNKVIGNIQDFIKQVEGEPQCPSSTKATRNIEGFLISDSAEDLLIQVLHEDGIEIGSGLYKME